ERPQSCPGLSAAGHHASPLRAARGAATANRKGEACPATLLGETGRCRHDSRPQPRPSHTIALPAPRATCRCTKYIAISESSEVDTTTYPRTSKCRSVPSAFSAMIDAATTDPSPPESCCNDALMALNEPRCDASGMADISACDGIIRE